MFQSRFSAMACGGASLPRSVLRPFVSRISLCSKEQALRGGAMTPSTWLLGGLSLACVHAGSAFILPTWTSTLSRPFHPSISPIRSSTLTRVSQGGAEDNQLSQPNPNEFFRLTKGLMEFGAYDEVEMVMFEAHELINRYMMENPERVLLATWDEELVQKKGNMVYQLTTRPVQFITVNLQPSLDIKVWQEGEHIMIESQAHQLPGIERLLGHTLADTLKIEVKGKLRAVSEIRESRPHVRLVGEVVFFTSGRLPRLLALTPRQILESAAVTVNKRIMGYAKNRFIQNLADDFEKWVAELPEDERALTGAGKR